ILWHDQRGSVLGTLPTTPLLDPPFPYHTSPPLHPAPAPPHRHHRHPCHPCHPVTANRPFRRPQPCSLGTTHLPLAITAQARSLGTPSTPPPGQTLRINLGCRLPGVYLG